MARRGNNIYHRADGRWDGRYYCKGIRKYKSVYGKTYTETKEKLDRIRNEVLVPSKRCYLLFSDIMKMWLESRCNRIKAVTELGGSSGHGIEFEYHNHFLLLFGCSGSKHGRGNA